MAATSVSQADIISALWADPDFGRWTALRMMMLQIADMPEILGAERLAEKITFRGLILLQAEVCRLTLKREFSDIDPDGRIRCKIRDIGNSFVHLADVAGPLYDMHEPNPQRYFFTPDVRRRYLAGELTYAELLRLQPGLLIPKFTDV